MSEIKIPSTKCEAHEDCFAYLKGECRILKDTDFGERDCPFFKTDINAVQRKEGRLDG